MSQSTASKPLLIVLGATGNQGKAVLKHFLSSGKFNLRAITRNTHSPAAEDLEQQGIETFQADLNDQSSLERAFLGATYIFATTDSNQLIFQAIEKPDLLDNEETPRDYAKRIELAQGRNIADAAAKTETLQRIVWSSLPGPKKWSHGKYSKVSMFDTKEEISEILGSKVELKDKLSVLLIGFYATNALKVKDLYGPSKQSDGTYELALPMSGDVKVPIADLDADVGSWTEALFQTNPGTVLVGATEFLTWKEWLSLWAAHNRVSARFRKATQEEFAAKIPGISDAVAEEFAFVEEFGFHGGNSEVVFPDDLRSKGIRIKISTIRDQVRRCDWSSLL